MARRFWRDAVLCGRRIFCEQFDEDALARYGRCTQRLGTIVHHLGLAVGGSNVVDPKLLTYAEKLQYEGYLRRQETNEAIRELSKKETSIRQIVRQLYRLNRILV